MYTTTINSITTKEVLNSISIGDTITNAQNITGVVISIDKGINCGVMEYNFSIDSGKSFTEYSFNKRPL